MKLNLNEAENMFGCECIEKLLNLNAEPTGRVIYPEVEPQHSNMVEYVSGGVYVYDGVLFAYYYQPEDADDWEYGEMNGIEYGDIEFVEFVEQ